MTLVRIHELGARQQAEEAGWGGSANVPPETGCARSSFLLFCCAAHPTYSAAGEFDAPRADALADQDGGALGAAA